MTDATPQPPAEGSTLLAQLVTLARIRVAHNATAGELAILDAAQGAVMERDRLKERATALEQAVRTLHMWSRRYCDGRSTYAPADHNLATHTLLSLGVALDKDPTSTTGPFAADGSYGLGERERAALAPAGNGEKP